MMAGTAALESVKWRDLAVLSRGEVAAQLYLSAPWLALELCLASAGWYFAAWLASAVFFLAAMRQVHDGFHRTLGLGRSATHWFLGLYSVLMLAALHAIRFNHLRHHRHCLGPDDTEGSSARMSAVGAILLGPVFAMRQHIHALRFASRAERRWVIGELMTIVAVVLVAVALGSRVLLFHIGAMALANCLTAFFAVWTVHHGCDGEETVARTVSRRVFGLLSYELFYHVEHHLFPQVPASHLPQLANRLDRQAPECVV